MSVLHDLLRELTEAPGLPGYEDPVREIMERRLQGLGELSKDRLGSVIARKEGSASAPRIMFAGHMDEIGFMVTHITDEGFLRFQTLGGWWEQVMLAQRVTVHTHKGVYTGTIGSKPPHILSGEERKKTVEKKDMFIDIGVSGKAEAEALGVRPGDPVVPICPYQPLANEKYVMAKAWDNRFACALVIEILRRLKEADHPNTAYGVATVQEEVGLRGAMTSTHVIQPDIGFAFDTSIAGDTPGVQIEEAQGKLGKGPVVLLYDASMIPHQRLRNFVVDVAAEIGVPLQFDTVPGGGTDAGRIHLYGAGVPSLVVGVPVRYIHSHAGIMHLDDFENIARLMTEVIRRLDQKAVEQIIG